MSVLLDILCEFLSIFMQNTVWFNACKCLGPPHTVHQPWVNSYFDLTTVKMLVAPLEFGFSRNRSKTAPFWGIIYMNPIILDI